MQIQTTSILGVFLIADSLNQSSCTLSCSDNEVLFYSILNWILAAKMQTCAAARGCTKNVLFFSCLSTNHSLFCIMRRPPGKCIVDALLSTYCGTQRARAIKVILSLPHSLAFAARGFLSWFPSSINSTLVGAVFVLPVAAPAWPYRKGNHHNKALWIISLGHLILSGSKLLSSTPLALARSQWTTQFC